MHVRQLPGGSDQITGDGHSSTTDAHRLLPQRLNQLWQVAIEPAAAIAEEGDGAGRQRQQFAPRDGGEGEMGC